MTSHLLVIVNHAYSPNVYFWSTVKNQADFEHLTQQFKASVLETKGDQVLAYTEQIVASLIPEIKKRLAVAKASYHQRLTVKPDLSRQEKSNLTRQANHDCEQLQRYMYDNMLYRKATDLNDDIQRLAADGFDVYLSQIIDDHVLFNGVSLNKIPQIIKAAQTIIDSPHSQTLHDNARKAFRTNEMALEKLKGEVFDKTDYQRKTVKVFYDRNILRSRLGVTNYPTYLASFDWRSTDDFKQVRL